ncbi:MAG: hypothetical protein QM526_01525 [Alphaproteobacteria bacterium]|nr:hypothetical protein [Alphaproteobacteria bacterium]
MKMKKFLYIVFFVTTVYLAFSLIVNWLDNTGTILFDIGVLIVSAILTRILYAATIVASIQDSISNMIFINIIKILKTPQFKESVFWTYTDEQKKIICNNIGELVHKKTILVIDDMLQNSKEMKEKFRSLIEKNDDKKILHFFQNDMLDFSKGSFIFDNFLEELITNTISKYL